MNNAAAVNVVADEDLRRALDADRIVAAARTEAGYTDFGNEDFFVSFRKLLEFSTSELIFRPFGLKIFEGDLRRFLVNRLRYRRDVVVHPEILDEDVSDPLLITGMPRTGTTKLQRMMSADPNLQPLWTWRVLHPAPLGPLVPGQPDPRIALARSYEHDLDPFKAAHESLAEAAEEDLFLLSQSLEYFMQISFTPAHGYLRWLRERPRDTAYHYEKKMLQYLQWQDGGKRGRRWLLKTPSHIGALDVVVDVFPKATILYSHRNMSELLASYCHLMNSMWQAMYAHVTPEWVGRHAIEYWVPEMERFVKFRRAMGDRLNLLEVPYVRVMQQPIAVAEEFYARAGLKLTEQGRAAMQAWADANLQHKYGKAAFTLEQFGLTEAMIEQHFPSQR